MPIIGSQASQISGHLAVPVDYLVIAGGGGGGAISGKTAGSAGSGGASNGLNTSANAAAATANTGSGGGGGGYSGSAGNGGAGGSGIVILRFTGSITATSTTGSPTRVNTGGYTYYTYLGSGSITL